MNSKAATQTIVSKKNFCRVAVFSLATLAVAGCTPPGAVTDTGSNTTQPAACGNETKTTVEGAGAGALLGALAGGLAGHSGGSALIGGAAGAALGTGAGYLVANKNCTQATTEAGLQEQIDTATRETARYQQDANYYDSRAADAQETASRLRAEYKAGSLSAANYRARMATFQTTNAKLQNELAEMQASQQRLQQQASAAGPNGGPLTQQAQQQADAQAQMQSDLAKFSNTLAEVPQG